MRVGAVVKGGLRGPYHASRELARLALYPVNPHRPRRLDVCCCGLSKTGTHSLAGIFGSYRSAHHPDARVRLRLAVALLDGRVDDAEVRRVLRRRDRLLWLEMESSSLAGILIEPLVAACPTKRFVLTIRDVYSWCDSWIDHYVNRPTPPSSPWGTLDRIRLRVGHVPPTGYDAPLTARGLPPLACYFGLWAAHNAAVLDAVPPDRLLIVRTQEITPAIPAIAAWAGVPPETLRADRARLFAAPAKHRVLSTLDPAYVQETADRLCGDLMAEYFPGASWEAAIPT